MRRSMLHRRGAREGFLFAPLGAGARIRHACGGARGACGGARAWWFAAVCCRAGALACWCAGTCQGLFLHERVLELTMECPGGSVPRKADLPLACHWPLCPERFPHPAAHHSHHPPRERRLTLSDLPACHLSASERFPNPADRAAAHHRYIGTEEMINPV